MLDGTDVDALIAKKRAHKTIFAEAFNSTISGRFAKSKKKTVKREATMETI